VTTAQQVPAGTPIPTLAPNVAQQVPAGSPTPIAGQPNIAATATFAAILQQITQQQQQIPGTTPTSAVPNATATYAAVLQALNNQLTGGATPTPSTASAQTTAPLPPAAPIAPTAADACSMSLASASGGQTLEYEQVQLTLPTGNYTYGFIRPETGGQSALVVCSQQTNSTIYFDSRTGQETARRANSEAGTAALNQLRSAVRTTGSPSGVGGATISPPSTGDGGLAQD
jgi:hypothetical protein